MLEITIYTNNSCSKCQKATSILSENDISLDTIEYLKTTLSKEELTNIITLGIPAKDLIRTDDDEWSQTGLDIETASDDDLIDAIIQYPILLQRPIVIANGKAVIARPPERVLEIL